MKVTDKMVEAARQKLAAHYDCFEFVDRASPDWAGCIRAAITAAIKVSPKPLTAFDSL
jgi:hypothetical protein